MMEIPPTFVGTGFRYLRPSRRARSRCITYSMTRGLSRFLNLGHDQSSYNSKLIAITRTPIIFGLSQALALHDFDVAIGSQIGQFIDLFAGARPVNLQLVH